MIINQVLKEQINILTNSGINSAQIDAELLLSNILDKNREYLLTYPENTITKKQYKKFVKLVKQRLKGYSVAVLIGSKDFLGFNFVVDKNVLVPRPETELMVEEVNSILKTFDNKSTIIDLGTGSGCIIISLAKLNKNNEVDFYAVDVSRKALKIAKQNAEKHEVKDKIIFKKGNLLNSLKKQLKTNAPIIITANLPYLTPKQVKDSPSIHKEPKLALVAGNDGLKYYRELFKDIRKRYYDKECYIFCEIDPSQTSNIKELAKNELPKYSTKIINDYANLDRFLMVYNQ